jgi:hypothetical protein
MDIFRRAACRRAYLYMTGGGKYIRREAARLDESDDATDRRR